MTGRQNRVIVALLAVLATSSAVAEMAADVPEVREWSFRVLLDDDEIGYHRFKIEQQGDLRRVQSFARFDVRFLFFNAYRYRHTNAEEWDGLCLQSIETDTDANGTDAAVSGQRQREAFVVETGSSVNELPDCVMSFAYWEPEILEQKQLLNAQTGEYLDVSVQALDRDVLTVRGRETNARSYRITAKGMRIDLWYSDDDEWLALESLAKGGRLIRYELT